MPAVEITIGNPPGVAQAAVADGGQCPVGRSSSLDRMSRIPAFRPPRWPALAGGLIALLAAVLFGISTPLVQSLGVGVGSFTTASLLYAGAALIGAILRRPMDREAGVQRGDASRLVLMALFGAAIGPGALAWGLQHTSGTSASLMLTLEAVFTAVLARLWYQESLDRKIILAMSSLTLGGAVLVLDRARAGNGQLAGLLAVLAATGAWGVDNTLSRALSGRDPGQVVMLKGTIGAAATALLAVAVGETLPALWGATGLLLVGAGLMILGVLIHLTEAHAHDHAHESMEHAHAHVPDEHHAHRH